MAWVWHFTTDADWGVMNQKNKYGAYRSDGRRAKTLYQDFLQSGTAVINADRLVGTMPDSV